MPIITAFFILFAFWLALSGKFDAFHLTLGVISTAIVTFWTGDLLLQEKQSLGRRMASYVRLIIYSFWLVKEIVLANIQVLKLALSPQLEKNINPKMISFKTKCKSDFSKFVFATSITLTPGTVTVRIQDDEFLVHAINDEVAASLPGDMEKRVCEIFGEDQ